MVLEFNKKILSVVGQQVSFLNVILLSLFVITIYQAFQYLKELYTRNILWTIEYKLRNKVSLYILKGTYQSVLK